MENLVQNIDHIRELFLEVLKLLLPLLEQGSQAENIKYETSVLSNILEVQK